MKTPWGESQTIEQVAPGIKFVTTSSHGGYKIDHFRRSQIPRKVLATTWGGLGLKGWFEEDEDCVIVYCYFPEAMAWNRTADWVSLYKRLKRINPAAHADLTEKGVINGT